MLVCFLNGLSGTEPACPPFSVLDCHASFTGAQGPTVPQRLSRDLEPWTLRDSVVLLFVFELVLASSHHLQCPSLGTWQRSLKHWLNLPLETQACPRLLVVSDILRRLLKNSRREGGVIFQGQFYVILPPLLFSLFSSHKIASSVPVLFKQNWQ